MPPIRPSAPGHRKRESQGVDDRDADDPGRDRGVRPPGGRGRPAGRSAAARSPSSAGPARHRSPRRGSGRTSPASIGRTRLVDPADPLRGRRSSAAPVDAGGRGVSRRSATVRSPMTTSAPERRRDRARRARGARLPRRRRARDVDLPRALALPRPLLLEGEAGVGKTEVAQALARWTGGELVRLQCYEGIDASQAVYEWDYSRQLLHLRAAEASGAAVVEDELYSERFLVRRPLLRAIDHPGAVAAGAPVDEVDRADDEFEAFLLEILSDYTVSGPRARRAPRRGAADRRAHVEPHARRARRAEAPLPVPLDRPSRLRARARDRAAHGARGVRGAGARGRGGGRGPPRARALQAAGRRGDDRLGAGPHAARSGPPRRRRGRGHPRHGPQVPRGPATGARTRCPEIVADAIANSA